jgi:hypothetical protein
MKKLSQWFSNHISLVVSIIFVVIIAVVFISKNKDNHNTNSTNYPGTTTQSQASPKAGSSSRQGEGKQVSLGTGDYTGGKQVAPGLYDVTAGIGQNGNFFVSGKDSYNEIIGKEGAAGGVLKLRAKISTGDEIQISGISNVLFTPVTAPYITTYGTISLYSGTFVVGQDIGAGKYVATPGSGENGNFVVTGTDKYSAILGGDKSIGGVPSVTVNLTKGDVINITSLNQVTLTATN